jgi:hypothetical protein
MRWIKRVLTSACLIASGLSGIGSTTRADQSAPAAPQSSQDLRTPGQRFADINSSDDPSFRRHLVPLLARAGCSARECHGSFQGRGGFQLSLFGSEWDHDFLQLTKSKGDEDEIHINAADPQKSLILLKPTMQVKHKGKERFKKDGWEYNLILKWIRSGAKNDADKTGELQSLEVTPPELVFTNPGQAVQLRVLAHWNNGDVEDVTQLTRFKTNDETVANVSEAGLVSCTGKGDSHVVASYDSGVLPIPVMLPVSEFAGSKFPAVATRTKLDELVVTKLRKVGIVPSEICTDSEFLRRVSLDLTGTLPTPDEVTKFLADPSSGKRAAKIEELLNTPSYAAWWTTKFCDYTGNNPRAVNMGQINRNPGEISRQWYDWLYKRITTNVSYDQIVADIVLATSRSSPTQSYQDYALQMNTYFRADHPADYADHPTLPYFWQRKNVQLPQDKALAFAHTFMGVRIECAQCHKHPFDRWTKQDFAQFTAFFNSVNSNPRPALPGDDTNYQKLLKELKEEAEKRLDEQEAAADAKGSSNDSKKNAKATTQPVVIVKATTQPVGLAAANSKDAKDAKDVKFDPKRQQKIQRLTNEIVKVRIDEGKPVPWQEVWVNTRGGPVKTKKPATVDSNTAPKILGGQVVDVHEFPDARKPLMDWLRDKSNPYFAKAFVNRVWASYFNRGIVNPPDDLNLANAPSNGALLNYLADAFIAHNYDMKWLHREILNSDTYQRSWKTNSTNRLDERNFSHAVVRQLPAEVMLDAISMAVAPDKKLATFATEVDSRGIGPSGTALYTKPGKGGAAAGNDGYFLTLFGRPAREANCDCERSTDPTLLQTLFTRNDPQLLGRIEGAGGAGSSWVADLRRVYAKTPMDTDAIISQTFLRTVSRPPTVQEIAEAKADIAAQKTPVDGVRDLLWAMINTREFKVNH